MKIQYLGHACVRLISEIGTTVVCDPYDKDLVGYAMPSFGCDLATISHNHADHNCVEALGNLPSIMDCEGTIILDDVCVTSFATWHDDKQGSLRGQNLVFTFLMDALKVAHLGDLGEVNMDIVDNMMLRSYRKSNNIFVDRKKPSDLADRVVADLEVVTPSTHTPIRRLSGGNVQKVLVGREIAASPVVLMAAYPVRGLDINSSYTIYNLLTEQKKKGVAVVFVGEDLDVLLGLCDRSMVICAGKITGIIDGRAATKEGVGLLMTKTDADNNTHGKEVE